MHGLRFTPTGVGRTGRAGLGRRPGAVHPHGRGEDARWSRETWIPRRFTPTGVGRTLCLGKEAADLFGSPPRAWGGLTAVFDC